MWTFISGTVVWLLRRDSRKTDLAGLGLQPTQTFESPVSIVGTGQLWAYWRTSQNDNSAAKMDFTRLASTWKSPYLHSEIEHFSFATLDQTACLNLLLQSEDSVSQQQPKKEELWSDCKRCFLTQTFTQKVKTRVGNLQMAVGTLMGKKINDLFPFFPIAWTDCWNFALVQFFIWWLWPKFDWFIVIYLLDLVQERSLWKAIRISFRSSCWTLMAFLSFTTLCKIVSTVPGTARNRSLSSCVLRSRNSDRSCRMGLPWERMQVTLWWQ